MNFSYFFWVVKNFFDLYLDVWLQSGYVESWMHAGQYDLQEGTIFPWTWQLWPGQTLFLIFSMNRFVKNKWQGCSVIQLMNLVHLRLRKIFAVCFYYAGYMSVEFSFWCDLFFFLVGSDCKGSGYRGPVWLHWQI